MRAQPRHSPELRRQLLDLYQSGRDFSSLTREFGVPAWSLRRWVKAERDKAQPDHGLSSAEREALSEQISPGDAGQTDRAPLSPSLTLHFLPWESQGYAGPWPHVPVPLGTVREDGWPVLSAAKSPAIRAE